MHTPTHFPFDYWSWKWRLWKSNLLKKHISGIRRIKLRSKASFRFINGAYSYQSTQNAYTIDQMYLNKRNLKLWAGSGSRITPGLERSNVTPHTLCWPEKGCLSASSLPPRGGFEGPSQDVQASCDKLVSREQLKSLQFSGFSWCNARASRCCQSVWSRCIAENEEVNCGRQCQGSV